MMNLFGVNKDNNVKPAILKRIVSVTAAVAMSLTAVPLGELSPEFDKLSVMIAHAVNQPRRAEVSYNDLAEFAAYSLEYSANPDLYCEDIITLSLNTGATNTFPSSFVSLGTEDYPFNGKIYITQTYGDSWWFETDTPLFDYITDSAVINYSGSDHNTEAIPIELRRKEKAADDYSPDTPLFANHVTEGGALKATWSIKSAVQRQDVGGGQFNILVCNNTGLIGEMCENAQVTIEYANDAAEGNKRVDVIGTGNIGLICGTMQENSKIDLTLTGSNTGCLIESTGVDGNNECNAGGLIGKMNNGSVLKINGTYTPDVSREIVANSGYAGGLVGYCDGGKVEFPEAEEGSAAVCTQIRGTIQGNSGAGGLYGYYSNYVENNTEQSVTFNMNNYDIDCTVKATSAGGLFGVLNGKADLIVDGSEADSNELTVSGDTVTDFGGIAGTYLTNALTNKFEINTVTANTSATFSETSYYGGVCGQIAGENAAYIKVDGLTHKSSSGFADASAFGGVVGNAGTAGSMLDVGSITIETGVTTGVTNGSAYKGGGIVGVLTDGVLRLSGTTDLTKAPSTPASAKTSDAEEYKESGQLVGIRKDSLVYAVGSGNSGDSNWVFNRSTTQVNADDIATWGSVLRLSGIETDVLTFDATNHTVTVAAPVTAMASAVDFTKTALNMQLNSGDKGALKFADSTNTKSALLGTNLSFSGTINLSESGNIGLMRDDYKDNVSEIGEYTKTISGGTVNLAIGEQYGVSSASVGKGDMVAHRYNGLIARTGVGAGASGLTVGGTINVDGEIADTYVGGVFARVTNGISLSSVTANETININALGGSPLIAGGMAGYITAGTVSILGGTVHPTINLAGSVGNSKDDSIVHSFGGAIGRIDSASAQTITVGTLTVNPTISSSGITSVENISAAGLIADITGDGIKTMSLTGVTVNGASLTNTATSHAGGFLGMRWRNTNVSFTANNGVIVSGTNTITTSANFAAGLVQQATGHWIVPEKGIKISGMNIENVTNSLGLLVHDGYYGNNGLYLELTHKDSYDLAATGISVPATTYYDELVRSTGSDILSNGSNGIISITTDGDLIMDGTNCNTYQNKYNKGNLTNNKSRYYYNLTSISAKENKSDGEKLLLWSLNKYAAGNINGNFTNSLGTPLTGNFDLEHISYYPIDCPDNLTIGDATFIFYNDKIEGSESGTGNSDIVTGDNSSSGVRTTRGNSQHYLMHSGVFRNVAKNVTTNGNIHFKGVIGADATYSGALINGTLSGSLTSSSSKEIVFEGLTLSDPSKYLFINKLSQNSKLTLSGVRTGGGKDFSNADKSSTETRYTAGATVASSLIGDVSGNGIQVSFDRMKLDSRTNAGSPADWSAQYGTTKSIFSGATLLNRFAVDNNSTGVYNFEESLDWTGSTHNAGVTYGQEIKTSKEYKDSQQKYYQGMNFVDPVAVPSSSRTEVYPFDSGFLPYVRYSTATTTGDDATRELKVNVSVAGITDGCGTYNHPYEITEGWQLTNVATAINQTNYPDTLRLPDVNGGTYATQIANHWCTTKNTSCAVFTKNASTNSFTHGSYTWTSEQVSLYLASAYYVVKNDITISGAFPGLGATPASDTNKTGKFAFRGVIVGASSDGSVKISMSVSKPTTPEVSGYENTPGLITMSNGSVVKNLTIEVTPYETDNYNYKVSGNQAYGYNEKFSNYGAVINKIMGGDNIIDNVSVSFTNYFKVNSSNDYKATVGGYVGCVVNGGLIFRNVDDTSLTNFTVKRVNDSGAVQNFKCNGNTITNLTDEKDLIHIHVNPFVGRVINGYAIHETVDDPSTENVNEARYAFSEDGTTYGDGETRANAVEVTMHNTRKNYSIPDIDTTKNYEDAPASVLTFSKPEGETSYNTISVPNSQALYIMSIIAQSGSGCASSDDGDYAYNISYCGSATRNYTGSNNTLNNKATHWAAYDAVGSDTKGDDYNLSKKDTINSKIAVPYIIYKYTSSYDNETKYPARTLTKRTFYVNLSENETYYLPDCFRGIGFLGSAEYVNDNMKIYGFNGNGATIDLNAEYFTNRHDDDPYYGGNSVAMVCGLAMFNSLQQFTSDSSNQYKYETDPKYQITDFTLQGYISAHHVKSTGADDDASPDSSLPTTHFCTAGFVSCIRNDNIKLFNISSVDFIGFHINSYSCAGGLFAYFNDSSVRIYINNCNADGFKIEGSGRIGGFVGSYDSTKGTEGGIHINTGLDSNGNNSYTSVMKNTIINNRFTGDKKFNYSAGIIGSVYCTPNASTTDQGDHALGTLILRNVTIEGGNAETNYIGNKDNPNGSSGGIIGGGSAKVQGCLIQNCIVKNIDIYGRHAGGIFGENSNFKTTLNPPSVTGARIVGCTVSGELAENGTPQYSIVALQYAGGVYGATCDKGTSNATYKNITYQTDIDGVNVYGYNICSRNTENLDQAVNTADNLKKGFAAGGIAGNNDNDRKIQNCKVEKCVIDVGTNADSATNTPCGGLIGRINSGTICGYNIEVKDCDFQTHQWENGAATHVQKAYSYTDANNVTHNPVSGMKCGNVIGNGNSKVANITAIHVENCPAETDFNSVAVASFNVYADYSDTSSGSDKGTEMPELSVLPTNYTNVGEGGLKSYFPNVNVSPVIQMGADAFLTSDGAALYDKSVTVTNDQGVTTTKLVATPMIDAIVNDDDSNYHTASDETKTYIQNALLTTSVDGQPNKISTYKTEMGELPDGVDDFTVLVINSEYETYDSDFINNYIKMVTNTDHNFNSNSNWANKYTISVYPCTYSSGNYVINAPGKTAGLVAKNTNGTWYYSMKNTHADSNQGDYQFSLMDVQFFNPNTSLKEVAYHLYIPILTKKMLMFDFYSASESGTDNKSVNFTGYGNTLAESLKSWYTGYLHFTYGQTELQSMLDSGAGLNWNSAKTIQFMYQTNNVDAKLADGTQLVLCDPNHEGDRYYYATMGDLRPENDEDGEFDFINFDGFATTLNADDITKTAFTPITLNQLLLDQGFVITAETASAGTPGYIYCETLDRSQADVIASDGTMYQKVADGGTVKLTITYPTTDENGLPKTDPLKRLVEDYYLAVRAVGDSVYNYSIRTPATIKGGSGKPTLRRSNADEGNVTNIIMGSLYKQTISMEVLNNNKTTQIIDAENHRLDVTLKSMIQLTGSSADKDYILGHLTNESIHLYQTFIVSLTSHDTTGNRSDILGTPNVKTDFTITGNGENTTDDDIELVDVTGSYIQLKAHDIKRYLSKSGIAMITAKTQIDFEQSWQYEAEFPKHDGSDAERQIGVNVSAKSNLGYNESKIRFTNMTEPAPTNGKYFYIKESDDASLVFNMKSEILDEYDKVGAPSFNYSQQGINPKNFIDATQTRLPIQAAATYNAVKIKRTDFKDAETVNYTLKLYKKTDTNDGVKYQEVDNIWRYIEENSVYITVNSGVKQTYLSKQPMTKTNSNELSYSAEIDQSSFNKQEDQRIAADIDFTVITGDDIKDYANYRFVLKVDLLKTVVDEETEQSNQVPITLNSNAHDWVVYTNAKINPDMLTISEYNGS